MKTVLICHEEDFLNRKALAAWLGSFTDLAGIVSIREKREQKAARFGRELRRLGPARFADVVAFRLYHRLFERAGVDAALAAIAARASAAYPQSGGGAEVFSTDDPNSAETEAFLRRVSPDLAIARCKFLLRPGVFEIPALGTYVLHPGICPEYRNAHGCFWALARRDLSKVGVTLLKIDRGIDTGPVYGYFRCRFDEVRESHFLIQDRAVFDNLPAIEERLLEISRGEAKPIETRGRSSRNWGQPWLSEYLKWKRRARAADRMGDRLGSLLYHDVTDSPAASGFSGKDADLYKLRVSTFIGHMDEIARTRLPVLAPRGAADSPPDEAVILTFDDGGESAHSKIAPLLEERGWSGVFFVVTDRVGKPGFLSSEQIRDLHRRGHVIGSHSHTHPFLFSSLSNEELDAQWGRSRAILEEIIGAPVLSASVPGGYFSKRVAQAAERAGYELLYNSEPVSTPFATGKMHVLGRFAIQRDTVSSEAGALASGRGLARLKQTLLWNAKKPLKAAGGPAWLAFRKWILNRRQPA